MDYQALRQAARDSLDKAPYPPKRLALIHTGAALLLSVLMTAVNYFLLRSFNAAVGLGNLKYRAILETVQTVLSFANLILTPMWTIGFLAVALRTARWSNAEPRDLLDGFRNWGTTLRLYILHAGLIFLLVFACSQISSILFAITPLSRGVTQVINQALQAGQDPIAAVDQLSITTMLPLFGLLLVTLALIGIPLFYRFRLSFFAVAEGEKGARRAMGLSALLTRNNRMELFRLDLHFWWYYIALLLLSGFASIGDILELVNLSLPISKNLLVYGSYGIYLVLQLLLNWQFSLEIRTTYAHYYDQLKAERLPPEPQLHADPSQNPWDQTEN